MPLSAHVTAPVPAPDPAGAMAGSRPSGYLTAKDLAAATGWNLRTIQLWCKQGRLRAFKPEWARCWLVSKDEALRLVSEAEGVRHDG